MRIKKLLTLAIFLFACLCFGGCDFSFTQSSKTLEISGTATYLGNAMENVSIKTNAQTLCKTDKNGKFSFTINANSVEIFAEKDGYSFSPRKIVLTESSNNINFIAEKVEELKGEIALVSVNISPTSIASIPDDYQFSNNSQDALKLKNLKVVIDGYEYKNFIENGSYANKQQKNIFSTTEEHYIKTDAKFSIQFMLSAKFRAIGNEYDFNETRLTTLNVPQDKTTANLNDDNQFEVSLYGINSSNNMFSYNITFIFNYYPNI